MNMIGKSPQRQLLMPERHPNKEGPLCVKGPTVCDHHLPALHSLCHEAVLTSNFIFLPIVHVEIEPRALSSFTQHGSAEWGRSD